MRPVLTWIFMAPLAWEKVTGLFVYATGMVQPAVTVGSRLPINTTLWTARIAVQTGIAIVNPSAAPVQVTFELANLSGVSTGLTGRTTVPAQGHVGLFANEIPGFDAGLGMQGVLRISAPTAVSVVGLRGRYNERGDFPMSTVPPSNEASPAVTTTLYMPHFVDGGGYTTQFILFSGSANQSSNGTLQFFSQTGQLLGLTLR